MGKRHAGLALVVASACSTNEHPGVAGRVGSVVDPASGSGSIVQPAGGIVSSGSGGGSAGSGALPKLVEHGGLSFEIVDEATGQRIPGKLTIIGVKGTRDPKFGKDIGHEEDTSLAAYNRVFSLGGVGVVPIPTGTYDVTASRGVEWTIHTQRVTVTRDGVELRCKLKHVVETPKWLSGDFHVHAAPSPDSRVPMRDRVYEFVADGIDMIVSTDHNVVSNYQPIIEEMHAEKLLTSMTGDEITTGDWGHFGAFPLPHSMELEGHGAIPVRKMTAAGIFKFVRDNAPDAVIDIHHPRIEKATGYFILGKFDDDKDTSSRKGFSYDFDAIEVLNGYQDTNRKSIDRIMKDWFALLDRGHIVTATGNSDTHHLTYNLGGYPRNYIQVDDDDPATVKPVDISKAIKKHHAFFTTGPIVAFSVNGAGIGDIAKAPGGKAKADIAIRAAPWISVSRVMLYVAGKEVKRWEVDTKKENVDRFHVAYDFVVPKDTYALVRVEGDRPLSPVVGGGHGVEVTPFALTNPVLIDTNGNGTYDPALHHGDHGDHATDETPGHTPGAPPPADRD
jgi:hypothetical protein